MSDVDDLVMIITDAEGNAKAAVAAASQHAYCLKNGSILIRSFIEKKDDGQYRVITAIPGGSPTDFVISEFFEKDHVNAERYAAINRYMFGEDEVSWKWREDDASYESLSLAACSEVENTAKLMQMIACALRQEG